jgi:hypothetical protein
MCIYLTSPHVLCPHLELLAWLYAPKPSPRPSKTSARCNRKEIKCPALQFQTRKAYMDFCSSCHAAMEGKENATERSREDGRKRRDQRKDRVRKDVMLRTGVTMMERKEWEEVEKEKKRGEQQKKVETWEEWNHLVEEW